jgi:glycosyltransferase involved in cell wall biosynthesis
VERTAHSAQRTAEAPPPLVITQIVAPGVVGGTESVVRALAVGHHRRGHEVHVIGVVEPEPRDHPYLRELSAAGVTVHPLHLRSRAYLTERRLVKDILERHRPDVVHVHGYRPEFIDAPVARRLGIPVVTTLHGSSRISTRAIFYERIQKRLLHRCDAVVAVSNQIVEELRAARVPDARVHYIPNGWVPSAEMLSRDAARRALGVALEVPLVGWVGRLIPIKGCDVFVRAFAACRGRPVHGAVIGDGPERERVTALRAECGLEHQLQFLGALPLAAQYFRAFDLFVLSSRSEGTPITMLEAMAADVPVVSARVGAIPDLFTDDEIVLVAPENPEALGAAINASLADPDAARARASRASEKVRGELGPDAWLSRHEVMYRAIRRG